MNLEHKLMSRPVAIALLGISTFLDCATTYASTGHDLSRDGNPFIRSFNWAQLLTLQAVGGIVIALAFWFASSKQQRIWPEAQVGFWSFLKYRLTKSAKLSFRSEHIQTEAIYAGVLMLWCVTFAHLLAGIVAGSPMVGGPSFLDVLRPLGIRELRPAQNVTTLMIIVVAVIASHYPLYRTYAINRMKPKL